MAFRYKVNRSSDAAPVKKHLYPFSLGRYEATAHLVDALLNHTYKRCTAILRTGINEEDVIAAAILHDTIEDTDTSAAEISDLFGGTVLRIVLELSDDKSLPKATRKQLQIDNALRLSREAKLVKLADKICNLRDMAKSPPFDWPLQRQQEYFDWANAVVDGLRGTHNQLEKLFDQAYDLKPNELILTIYFSSAIRQFST